MTIHNSQLTCDVLDLGRLWDDDAVVADRRRLQHVLVVPVLGLGAVGTPPVGVHEPHHVRLLAVDLLKYRLVREVGPDRRAESDGETHRCPVYRMRREDVYGHSVCCSVCKMQINWLAYFSVGASQPLSYWMVDSVHIEQQHHWPI